MKEADFIKVIHSGHEACLPDKQRRSTIPYSNMIHFIEDGYGYFNGMLLGPGQGFICRKNHRSKYEPLPDNPWTYSWINVIGNYAEEILDLIPSDKNVFTWTPSSQLSHLKELPCPGSRLYTRPEELLALSIFCRVSSELADQAYAAFGKSHSKPDYASLLKTYLENNYEKNITITQAALNFNISRAYLRNLFYNENGMSPQEYLINLRLRRAEFLLMNNEYSITEVAMAVGYNDVLQFSRIFKKHNGVSPTDYRKRFEMEL